MGGESVEVSFSVINRSGTLPGDVDADADREDGCEGLAPSAVFLFLLHHTN